MSSDEDKPRLNQKFPACAQVARRLLAEVYGCVPGDLIPGEDELLERARQVRDVELGKTGAGLPIRLAGGMAEVALAMVEEIGGIFERPEPAHTPEMVAPLSE